MKYSKTVCILALSIILALLVPISTTPAQAAGGVIILSTNEGKIGDWIKIISGEGFDASEVVVRIYFSSDKAERGDKIGVEVTAYEQVAKDDINADGTLAYYEFTVPDALTHGEEREDVHGGEYYVYVTYYNSNEILAVARFTVIDGEIWLSPEEGTVGSEVEISGEELRPDQKIAVNYDGEDVAIASGDSQTDDKGRFTCTINIPESTVGSHVITVIDESGNRPEAGFTVKPEITITPTSQAATKAVNISGTGFLKREVITITFDGNKLFTTPGLILTDYRGSFNGSFLVPSQDIYGTSRVEAMDSSFNRASVQLIILASINLSPITSPTSPGHVGMELRVQGAGFTPNAVVTLTYSNNDQTIPVVTASVDGTGNFWEKFIVPPSVAGSHDITATDGTSTVTSSFIMESQAPPMPVPLRPKIASTAGARTHFVWEDVTDPSGVSYSLQVASDADFTNILLEREGLSLSEYTAAEEEKLELTGKEFPYYWRVKAIDGAFNESEWTPPRLFYVGFSWTSMPAWAWYIFYGLGALLLGILGFWMWRKRTK